MPCLAIVVCYARIFFIVRKAAARSGAAGQRTRRSPGLSGQASSAETCLVPPGVTRGSMRVGMAGGKKKQATLEPSFQLTCCESQQGSGSTEVSEDPPMSSDQVCCRGCATRAKSGIPFFHLFHDFSTFWYNWHGSNSYCCWIWSCDQESHTQTLFRQGIQMVN